MERKEQIYYNLVKVGYISALLTSTVVNSEIAAALIAVSTIASIVSALLPDAWQVKTNGFLEKYKLDKMYQLLMNHVNVAGFNYGKARNKKK